MTSKENEVRLPSSFNLGTYKKEEEKTQQFRMDQNVSSAIQKVSDTFQGPVDKAEAGGGFMLPTRRKKRIPIGFSKFFAQNDIRSPVTVIGKSNNVRFVPDGVVTTKHAKLKEIKKRHEDQLIKRRKAARKRNAMKNRNIKIKSGELGNIDFKNFDMMEPLQSLVLQDPNVASILFYNIFEALYDKEMDDDKKEKMSDIAFKLLSESNSCDSHAISSIFLIILKLIKSREGLDASIIEKAGIKSLNFSKAILILEESIILKLGDDNVKRAKYHDGQKQIRKNKEWICLKRLHEASDRTGILNLMLDEVFCLEDNNQDNSNSKFDINVIDISRQGDKKELAKFYLDQLEMCEQYDQLEVELHNEIKHQYYKC